MIRVANGKIFARKSRSRWCHYPGSLAAAAEFDTAPSVIFLTPRGAVLTFWQGNVFPVSHPQFEKLFVYSAVRSFGEMSLGMAYPLLDCRRAVKL